ncbi:MAG: MFS transporter [Oxalobacter sp.]|nr:MAG: MFS transporter [Oxalobacter sp.]
MNASSEPATVGQNPHLSRQILLLAAGAFSSALSTRISDPILPQLSQVFGITIGEAASVISAYALAYGFMLLVYGPVGDRYGKFRVITIAAIASLVGALGSALAISFQWLTLFRFLNGATACALIPLSMAWIGDNVPYERRQHVLAYFMSGQILGLISGQAVGGFLADVAGWRSVFYFQVLTYLIVGTCLVIETRRSPGIDRKVENASEGVSFSKQIVAVIGKPWPQQVLLTVFVEGFFLFSALAFVPSFLHHQYGLSLTTAGLSMGMFGIGGLCYTLFARFFVTRFGERGLALGGGGLISLAFLQIIFCNGWHWVLPAMWCAGIGFYMLHNTLQTNATQMAPAARGTAVALFASCFFTGQSLGVWLASMSVDRFGFYAVFCAAALTLPIIGFFFSTRLREKQLG